MDIHASCMMNAQTLTKELSEHAHSLQRKLWKEMALVKVPKIRFRYDDSGESSSQIYTTIKNLNI
jgi:ribosome-binding factor A